MSKTAKLLQNTSFLGKIKHNFHKDNNVFGYLRISHIFVEQNFSIYMSQIALHLDSEIQKCISTPTEVNPK